MKKIKLAVFAKQLGEKPTSENYIAQALLLNDTKNDSLVCEIHLGKMITRFTPSQDYFFEDLLWQLNNYCQIPTFEIECDVHYPEPIPIEEEFGDELCMSARESIQDDMIESGIHFHVINWSSTGVLEKVNNLRSIGVNIQAVDLIHLVRC
jgi:hypothetical protein